MNNASHELQKRVRWDMCSQEGFAVSYKEAAEFIQQVAAIKNTDQFHSTGGCLSLPRRVKVTTQKKRYSIGGATRKNNSVYRIDDLSKLIDSSMLFAHPFDYQIDHVVLDCLEHHLGLYLSS